MNDFISTHMMGLDSLWCGCKQNMVAHGRDKCTSCEPRKQKVYDLDVIPSETDAACRIPGCGCRRFVLRRETARTLITDCEECGFRMILTKKFKVSRGSPRPYYGRCRRCDSEVVRGRTSNGTPRRSWACSICSYVTKASQSNITTGTDQWGRFCIFTGPATSLLPHNFRSRVWYRIPRKRRDQILSGAELSEDYEEGLYDFLEIERAYRSRN